MSDPLTALMHAVQVMNLLKTLIMKTLREREETTTGGYSPMSFRSSDRQSEDGYDSQQEMETSGELRGTKSDYDDNNDHSHCHSSEEDEEGGAESSLSEIEECFLQKLDETTKGCSGEPGGYFQDDGYGSSPRSCSGYNMESAISFTDSKTGISCSSFTYGEKSRTAQTSARSSNVDATSSPSIGCSSSNNNDVEMMDKLKDSISPVSLFPSN